MWSYQQTAVPELYHHGVMGMKWGVRRYHDKNGDLTTSGAKRFAKVAANSRLSRRQEKEAIGIYAKDKKLADARADMCNRSSKKAYNKADKLVWKSEARQQKGDQAGFEKYQSKAWKMMAKSVKAGQDETFWKGQADLLSKKIEGINSGTIKAGQDFIVKTDISGFVLPGVVVVSVSKEIVEK